MANVESVKLYAWVGEDECGSGEIGIKQARVPAGMIPIVSTKLNKVDQQYIQEAMDVMGKNFDNKIMLCEFTFKKVIIEVGNV